MLTVANSDKNSVIVAIRFFTQSHQKGDDDRDLGEIFA